MKQKEFDLKQKVSSLLKNATSENDFILINTLDAACLILDDKFGEGFHKQHPVLAIKLTESLLKNLRVTDIGSKIKYGIGEYIDALRIVILEKEFSISGSISVDIPDTIRIE